MTGIAGDEELELYLAANVYVADGNLVLATLYVHAFPASAHPTHQVPADDVREQGVCVDVGVGGHAAQVLAAVWALRDCGAAAVCVAVAHDIIMTWRSAGVLLGVAGALDDAGARVQVRRAVCEGTGRVSACRRMCAGRWAGRLM